MKPGNRPVWARCQFLQGGVVHAWEISTTCQPSSGWLGVFSCSGAPSCAGVRAERGQKDG